MKLDWNGDNGSIVILLILLSVFCIGIVGILHTSEATPKAYLLHANADCEAALMAEPRLPYNVSLNVQNLCDGLATVVESIR